ncbi:MAG: hypothetical protein OEY97_08525 [Nitrospirota bacterium]|nr:hypothetical protein [Nitrospirota bacterium]
MNDTTDPTLRQPDPAPPKKGLPLNLIILFVLLSLVCVGILLFMLRGFHMFNTFQPDTEHMTPAVPGFP